MTEGSQDTHPDELRSDLDVLIEMARDVDHSEEATKRHLDALKTKLDTFVHKNRAQSGGESAG